MPTVLYVYGWRFFFYPNERNEPMHIHGQKAEKDCKYWIDPERYNIKEAYSYHMTPADKKIVRKIMFQNLDYIVSEWNKYHGGK